MYRKYLAFTVSYLWGYHYLPGTKPPLLETLPLMLNHVDIKVFLWLTRHDMSGNIQPGSKMELVKGLHTATNSQAEEGMKRRGGGDMFGYSGFNGDGGQRQSCAEFPARLFCHFSLSRARGVYYRRWLLTCERRIKPPNKPLSWCCSSLFITDIRLFKGQVWLKAANN